MKLCIGNIANAALHSNLGNSTDYDNIFFIQPSYEHILASGLNLH